LKKIQIVKASDVLIKPLVLDDMIQDEVKQGMMKKVTKKELKNMAEELGLDYDDAQIIFAKKLVSAYVYGKTIR
jgi:hypothetical protein